jgi:hypothetical protein
MHRLVASLAAALALVSGVPTASTAVPALAPARGGIAAPLAATSVRASADETDGGASSVPAVADAELAMAEEVPGTILVEPRPDGRSVEAFAAAIGGTAGPAVPGTGFVRVQVSDVAAALAAAATDPEVRAAQADHRRATAGWPSDPGIEDAGPYLDLMRLPRAWEQTTGAGTTIAVVDTGVSAHPDLAGALLPGVDLVDGGAPDDPNGHGTALAGAAAARADDGLGTAGAAPDATIMPVRVLGADGSGDDATIAEGVTWAAGNGADVVLLTVAGTEPAPVIEAAIAAAVTAGVTVVIAAGDGGSQDALYPAAYSSLAGAITVGSTDADGVASRFSSWGEHQTVTAPGEGILGAAIAGGEKPFDGTSMSAALVAGVAALTVADGTSEPAAVEAAVVAGARGAGPGGDDFYYGAGVADASATLGLGAAQPLDRAIDHDVDRQDDASDDVVAGARALQPAIAVSQSTWGALGVEGDVDWYSFAPPKSAHWVLWVERSQGGATPRVELFDAQMRSLGVPQSPSSATTSIQTIALDGTGPWFFRISDGSAAPNGGYYSVQILDGGKRHDPEMLTFTPQTRVGPAGTIPPDEALLADVSADGIADVVECGTSRSMGPDGFIWTPVVSVRAGSGVGFADRVVTAVPGPESRVHLLVADFDGDGVAEIIAETAEAIYSIPFENGAFGPAAVLTAVQLGKRDLLPYTDRALDVDGDGRAEVVGAISDGFAVVRDPLGAATRIAVPMTAASLPVPIDLDGDGDMDFVADDGERWRQGPDGAITPDTPLTGFEEPFNTMVAADMDQDGLEDLLGCSKVDGWAALVLRRGLPDGMFAPAQVQAMVYSWPNEVDALDVDGDGDMDAVVRFGASLALALRTSTEVPGLFLQNPDEPMATFAEWRRLFTDVDADGDQDIVTVGYDVRLQTQVPGPPTAQPGPKAWVSDVSPKRGQTGVGEGASVRVTMTQPPVVTSVNRSTVRLVDGITHKDVAAERTLAGSVLTISPASPLVVGRSYAVVVNGLVDAEGETQSTAWSSWFTVGAAGQRFTAVEPWRLVDTREDGGPVVPGEPLTIDLQHVLPLEATAVVLNVTAVNPTGTGNLRLYPDPWDSSIQPPLVSNLNVVRGVDQPNLVTVRISTGRAIVAASGMTTDVVLDIAGYYSPGGATGYTPLTPTRVMDTRDGTGGVPRHAVSAGRWVELEVAGHAGVPTNATAVVLNVTGSNPSRRTNVRVYPAPAPGESDEPPLVSNLNLDPGRDQPNLVTVALGEGGRIRFYTQSADVHLIADLAGYYAADGRDGFVPLAPLRVADSRNGEGLAARLAPGVPSTLDLSSHVPAQADAVVVNVTAANPGGTSNVRVYPWSTSGDVPLVSNLNVVQGRDEPNLAVVRLGANRKLSFFTQSSALDAVVDLSGYFTRYGP